MIGNRYLEITSVFSFIFYNDHGQSEEPKQEGMQDVERYGNMFP